MRKLDARRMAWYDFIVVMRNGDIAEMGRFEELMEVKGDTCSLYNVSQ